MLFRSMHSKRRCADSCPIANAIRDVCPSSAINITVDRSKEVGPWYVDLFYQGEYHTIDVPVDVDMVKAYDDGAEMQPFSFEVLLPWEEGYVPVSVH